MHEKFETRWSPEEYFLVVLPAVARKEWHTSYPCMVVVAHQNGTA